MLKISYDVLGVEGLRNIMIQVSETCAELDIDFFIVGAIARNIWLVSNDENIAGTKDIDFGIYVPNVKSYNNLRKVLCEKYNYSASSENAFCLISPDGIQIDLLPFGGIEEDGQVMIEGIGLNKINLDGFEEAYNVGSSEVKIGEENYTACSIPAIVILKMIAFDDRPNQRIKDIKDINLICTYYPDIESNLIWDGHFDLYENERRHTEVAMIVLGREIRKIISGNQNLRKRVINILDKAIHQESDFLSHMIEDPENETLNSKAKILQHVKQGIIE